MGKYEGLSNNDKQNIVNQGGTPISSKIIFASENVNSDTRLVDAVNIDWQGYKLGNDAINNTYAVVSYMNNAYSYLVNSYSYILQELSKKATTSDFSDLTRDTYIDTQITIYTAVNDKTNVPSVWNNDTLHESLPSGWYENTYPAGRYVFMSSCYKRIWIDGSSSPKYFGPCGTPIFLPAENGLNGNFKSTVFTKTNTTPGKPKNGANYSDGLPTNIQVYATDGTTPISGKEWSDGIPEGNELLWASTAIIPPTNSTGVVWTDPKVMADTDLYDVEFSPYLMGGNPNDTSTFFKPNDSNRHGCPKSDQRWFDSTKDKTITGVQTINNDGGYDNEHGHTPTWSEMIWRAERERINYTGNDETDWSDWVITRIKGEKGNEGISGPYKSTVFKRSDTILTENDAPVGGDYATGLPNPQNGWSDGIPGGSEALWSSSRTFTLNDNTGEWSVPQLVADTPTYDVEFSSNTNIVPTQSSWDPENKTNIWVDPTTKKYKNGANYTGDFTEMIWRAERTRATIQDEWSSWVITKIKGEDGIIPQPSDYYQTRYTRTNSTTAPSGTNLLTKNNPASQNVSDAVLQTTGGQEWSKIIPNNTDNKPNIWQTSRKVTWEQSGNTYQEKYSDEEWSDPFMLNGLPGESQPIHPQLLYKWSVSPESNPTHTLPVISNSTVTNYNGWTESPGTPQGTTNIFLWMIQGEYKITSSGNQYQYVSGNDYWTTPVCLSGKDGKPGNDGDDLEFIYCCPDSTTPTQFSGNDNPSAWLYDATNTEIPQGEDNHVDPQKDDYLGPDDINYTWTDHPVGVDIAHKYEYCSYRRKTGTSGSKTWGAFSQPFAWSIYGENGIDGDGIEYIYYISDKTPSEIISDLGTGQNSKNPANWSNNAANPKPTISQGESNYSDPQQDDYLGPKPQATLPANWWTDEPTGVSEETGHKYEYVSQRKYDGKTKTWGTFTIPTLWANYAKDGLAINMVLETDNDNVTVGLDTSGLVNADYNDVANVSLKYNGQLVNTGYYTLTLQLTKTYTGVSCTNNVVSYNYGGSVGTQPIISLSNNTITVNIKQGLPLQALGSILSCVLTAETNRVIDTVPANTPFTKIFKVTGIQMAIDAIYKLSMSTSSPHRNANNTGFVPVNIKLKSYTNNSSLATVESAAQKGYFVVCESSNEGTSGTSKWVVNDEVVDDTINKTFNGLLLPANYNHHKFTLYYKSGLTYENVKTQTYNTLISGATWMDEEELSGVYDGNNGVDSRSEEYIYLLTDDIDFLAKQLTKDPVPKYYDPTYWHGHLTNNYNTDDYPFLEGCPEINGIKYTTSLQRNNPSNAPYSIDSSAGIYGNFAINIWTDNPQGVSAEYPYEFRAARQYKTQDQINQGETAGWQPFETPKIWNNWSHIGEDGDGIEYIYYLCNDKNKAFTSTNNPTYWWTSDSGYQEPEYIREKPQEEEIWWTDNPTGVSENQKYEYVSIRKYGKIGTQVYWKSVNEIGENLPKYPNIKIGNWKTTGSLIQHKYDGENTVSSTDIKGDYTIGDYVYSLLKQLTLEYIQNVPNNNGITQKYVINKEGTTYSNFILDNNNDDNPYHADIWSVAALCAEYGYRVGKSSWCFGKAASGTNNYSQISWLMGRVASVEGDQDIINEISRIYSILYNAGFIINAKYQTGIWIEYNHKINNTKTWGPYSEPKLWSSHGEPGIPGDPGGSGLVFDFDNPSMQIAVNDSEHQNFIKDNQTVTTYLKVYSGEELIDATDVTLSISNGHSAFKTIYNSENKFGYTLFNATSTYKTTYYTWTIGDIDDGTGSGVANNGIIEQDEYGTPNTLTLSSNSFIEFKIELYKGQDNAQEYTKRVNLVPIQYGENGQDAELFELHCANSVIHKNTLTDTVTFEPTVAEYKVKHTKGNTVHELLTPGSGNAEEFVVYYKLISDNVQYTSSGSDTHTHIYTTIDGLESETGIYVGTGSVINVVNSQQSSHTSQTISTDPTDISGEEEKVISVREVALVDEQQNTLDNAQELILSALDEQYNFSTTLAAAGYVYRGDSITNAVAQLRDYARQLEAQGANYSETASQINATADKIETIGNTFGSFDDNTGDYVVNTGHETMYVSDKTQQSQVVTRENAARIREQDVTTAQTSINANDVTHLEQNNEQAAYGELNAGEQGSGTTQEILMQSGGNTDGYNLANNGQISVQTLLQENTSVSYIDVQLRHTTDNTVWDTDVLEIVYDGHNGVDGDSIEYIYYRSETKIDFAPHWSTGGNMNNNFNPTYWTPNGEVTLNGHDYTGESDFIPPSQQNNWFDHPQGVDEKHPWEYISSREKVLKSGSTTGKIWGRYTPPQLWSHYGETGRDGDGVEYIYAIGNSYDWKNAIGWGDVSNDKIYRDPRRWIWSLSNNASIPQWNENYQTQYEYRGNTNIWKDDPVKSLTEGQYQFVSVRKYKELTQEYINSLTSDDLGLMAGMEFDSELQNIKTLLSQHIGKHIWLPYSEPALWNYYAKDGETHPFKSTVFKRNATQPETPTGGSYDVPKPSGWSDGIPTGSGPIWASSALFNPGDTTKPTGTINGSTGWTTPQLMADTDLYDVEFAFDTGSNSQPATPTTSNRHKDGGYYAGQIWFDPTLDKNSLPSGKSWSDMVWRAEREKTPGTTTWSNWTITRIKGERGATGESAVVLDFTNDQINFAVLSNGKINTTDVQEKTTTLNILNMGDYYVSGITIISNHINTGETVTQAKIKCSIISQTSSSITYKFLTGNGNGNAIVIPENGIEVVFKVTLVNTPGDVLELSKTLKICGQHTGENAVTYELNISPNSLSQVSIPQTFNISVTKYNGTSISSLTTTSSFTSNSLSYSIRVYNIDKSVSMDINSNCTDITYELTSSTFRVNSTNYELRYLEFKLKYNNSTEIDCETIPIVCDGQSGAAAYVIDWTNDQINLAVDANGHIRPNQLKYIELNLDSLNGKWGNNPEYYISWSTDANSGHRPKEKFTLPGETTTGFNTVGYNATSGNNSEIQFKHALRLTTSDNDDYKKLWIRVGNNYNGNAGIPEEGIEILLTIKIRTDGFKNHSTSSGDSNWEYTTTKILRICGQHNGENAVTYEIIPSVNSINYTKQGPGVISYVVNKYDGLEISTLSSSDFNVSPTNLQAAWCRPDGEVSYMNIVGGNFINDIHTSGRMYLKLWSNDTLIDSETIPILHDGESIEGPQGFSGPIVRYRGVYDSSKVYLTGKYYTGDNESYKYDGTSILYKDIVWHETEKNYYVPNQIGSGTTNYYSSTDTTTGGCKGAGYLPANSAFNTTNWTKAQQFDFVATKLLYADQALINQISTHDLIATTSAGYPVAGVTSGANLMTDKNGTQIKSPLNTGSLSGKTITNSGSSDNPTSANNNSSVRIFAGDIKKNDKYSLTYAPFNVRQDGTAYMTKARISGDAIVEGDITANTLNLKQSTASTINGSFVNINDDSSANIYLPTLQTGITRTIFVLCNTTLQSQKIIKVQSGQGTLVWGENPKSRTTNPTRYIYVQSNMLYQLIGMNISETQTWTVVEIPLSPSEQSVEYKYIDVTKDVMLYGYKANYINPNDHTQGTTIKIAPYSDDEDLCAWGPLVTDNGSDITIEFYTFLDPEVYGDDTDNCALADLSNFAWIYQYGQPVGH